MKHLFAILLFVLAGNSGIAQQIDSVTIPRLDPGLRDVVNQYLLDAKKAHHTAKVMGISGGVASLVGGAMVIFESTRGYIGLFDWRSYGDPAVTEIIVANKGVATTGGFMFIAGTGVALGSILLFRKARKKNHKARALLYPGDDILLKPAIFLPHTQTIRIGVAIDLSESY